MTTVSQVKKAVQPLLQRNPDLALAGRLVVIKPVHHILRGIFIDRSLDSNVFVPTWLVMFMFKPNDRITLIGASGSIAPTRQVGHHRSPSVTADVCRN